MLNQSKKIKEKLGLNKYTTVRKTIQIQKDGTKLYYVKGYTLPLCWETIEEKGISHDLIINEIDKTEYQQMYKEARKLEESERKTKEDIENYNRKILNDLWN